MAQRIVSIYDNPNRELFMGTKRSALDERVLILLTLLVVIITPVASDSYTPSLPAMANAFSTSNDKMQFSMTTYLIGVSLSQLIYGPLSDKYGRKPIIILGILIGIGGSIFCVLSNSLLFILIGRFIQGSGAGVSNGLFRALMRDQFTGPKMSQVGSYAGMVYTIAFAGAPVLGGYLQTFLGWRANFIFIALVMIIILSTLWLFLPETHLKRDPTATKIKTIWKNYVYLITSPAFVGYTLISSFAYSGFVAYYTAAPFILEVEVGLKPEQFGWLSLGIAMGLFVGMFINVRLVVSKGVLTLLLTGIMIMLCSGLMMLISGLFSILNTVVIVIPIVLFAMASSFVFTNAMTKAFEDVGHIAGIAGGMYGCIQVLGASITSILVAKLSEKTQVPLAFVLTGLSLAGLILFYLLAKRKRSRTNPQTSTRGQS